jgi:hypothetical protein
VAAEPVLPVHSDSTAYSFIANYMTMTYFAASLHIHRAIESLSGLLSATAYSSVHKSEPLISRLTCISTGRSPIRNLGTRPVPLAWECASCGSS